MAQPSEREKFSSPRPEAHRQADSRFLVAPAGLSSDCEPWAATTIGWAHRRFLSTALVLKAGVWPGESQAEQEQTTARLRGKLEASRRRGRAYLHIYPGPAVQSPSPTRLSLARLLVLSSTVLALVAASSCAERPRNQPGTSAPTVCPRVRR